MDTCAPPRPCAETLSCKEISTFHVNAHLRLSAVQRSQEERDDIQVGLASPWLGGPRKQAPGLVLLVVVEAEGVVGFLSSWAFLLAPLSLSAPCLTRSVASLSVLKAHVGKASQAVQENQSR